MRQGCHVLFTSFRYISDSPMLSVHSVSSGLSENCLDTFISNVVITADAVPQKLCLSFAVI